MIYVTSDIHGEYELYKKALKKIDLKETDSLFILGNVVDYGVESMDVLMDMMYRSNVYPVLGNCDAIARDALNLLLENISALSSAEDFENQVPGVTAWLKAGGRATLEAFMILKKEEKEQVADFLQDFELYEKVTVEEKEYILVHNGFGNFDPEKPLDEYEEEDLISGGTDYDKVYYEDKILVTGHTLTTKIPANMGDERIYQEKNHIALNCGCGHGGSLAVLCLNTGEEYYFR